MARCPECARYYCRECIVEHDNRVLCTHCVSKLLAPKTKKRRSLEPVFLPLAFCVVLLVGWMCFYLLAEVLLRIPSNLLESTFQSLIGG